VGGSVLSMGKRFGNIYLVLALLVRQRNMHFKIDTLGIWAREDRDG
jgi:hypothetical protein